MTRSAGLIWECESTWSCLTTKERPNKADDNRSARRISQPSHTPKFYSIGYSACGFYASRQWSLCSAHRQEAGCPLWVKSGHWSFSTRCPLYPPKSRHGLSALERRTQMAARGVARAVMLSTGARSLPPFFSLTANRPSRTSSSAISKPTRSALLACHRASRTDASCSHIAEQIAHLY